MVSSALCAEPQGDERALRCLEKPSDLLHPVGSAASDGAPCNGQLFLVSDAVWGFSPTGRSPDLVSHPGKALELGLRMDARASLPSFFSVSILRKDSDTGAAAGPERFDRALCEQSTAQKETFPRFRCLVPRDTEALRVELDGFGTTILWGVQSSIESERPLVLDLTPGVLVTGRIPAGELTATLEPRGAREEGRERRFASSTAVQDSDGTLTFMDTAPGAYRVRLETVEALVSTTDVVIPRLETFTLPELANPQRFDLPIQIEPRHDGSGETWKVTLVPTDTAQSRARPATRDADETGWLVFDDLPPGNYLLLLEDAEGSIWSTEEVAVIDDSEYALEIDGIRIEGEAKLGDEPFTGELVFGTTQGSQRIKMRADANGDFHGLLPREGLWRVEISSPDQGCGECGGMPGTIRIPEIEVEAGPSGVAHLVIVIPDTWIEGRVFREEITLSGEVVRTPQSGALVVLARGEGPAPARGRQAQVWTDEDGRFRIRGISPGIVEIGASLREPRSESQWRTLDVRESLDAPEVELVLEEKVTTPVRVTGLGGAVGGASVVALQDRGLSAQGVTGPDGVVMLDLPARGSGVLLTLAEGFGLAIRRVEARLDHRDAGGQTVQVVATSGALELVSPRVNIVDEGWLASADGATVRLRSLISLLRGSVRFGDSLVLEGLEPGAYAFCVGPARCASFEVQAHMTTTVDLSEI